MNATATPPLRSADPKSDYREMVILTALNDPPPAEKCMAVLFDAAVDRSTFDRHVSCARQRLCAVADIERARHAPREISRLVQEREKAGNRYRERLNDLQQQVDAIMRERVQAILGFNREIEAFRDAQHAAGQSGLFLDRTADASLHRRLAILQKQLPAATDHELQQLNKEIAEIELSMRDWRELSLD